MVAGNASAGATRRRWVSDGEREPALTCHATDLLCQRMHDHRASQRGGWPNQQGRKILLDPGKRSPVCLLRSRIIVEDADRRHRVVGCIHHVVSDEALDITDDRNGALLDPAREFFGRASLCFSLTNGGVHGTLLHWRGCPESRLWRSFITPERGEQQHFPRTVNITPSGVTRPSGPKRSGA